MILNSGVSKYDYICTSFQQDVLVLRLTFFVEATGNSVALLFVIILSYKSSAKCG
jgi:hypothetical protein